MNEQRPPFNPSHPATPGHPQPQQRPHLAPQPSHGAPASTLPKVGALPQQKAEEVDLDPIGLVDEAPSAEGDKKIKAFGVVGMQKAHQWKRKAVTNGTGAVRMRTFHGKLSDQGMQYLDDAVNEWLDAHPEVEVKFVTSSVGVFEGKIREPALVLNLWYQTYNRGEMLGFDVIPPERFPRHIAIIMDGNGRWAVRRGLERIKGHQEGAKAVQRVVTECARLRKDRGGPDYLTLYSFSLENWKRPADEVSALMQMYIDYLRQERPTMMENNIQFRQIGRLENLPDPVLEEMDITLNETRGNTGLTLVLALNYGSRAEIVDAVRLIAQKAADKELPPQQITEETISEHLYTVGMPDPDLLVRTAGEMRISNYLLWQISYAELYVSEVLWPDFGEADLHQAIESFASRNRRFGALDRTNTVT